VRLVPPALDGQVRRRVHLQLVGAAGDALAERREVDLEDVAEALEAALAEEPVLGRPEPGEVQHLGLVAPHQDVVGRGADLVGEVLAPCDGLGDLEKEARREDALALEAAEVDRLDSDELVDRWHVPDDRASAAHEGSLVAFTQVQCELGWGAIRL
jgi:hypothetical protein